MGELGTLVSRLGAGDEAALALIIARVGGRTRACARRILGDEELADEAVAETFLCVWRDAARFDPRCADAARWIRLILYRRSLDITRRERHRHKPAPPVQPPPRATPSLEELAILVDEHQAVREAMRHLSSRQREILELIYDDGLTHLEIAERVGLSLRTVTGRHRESLLSLRRLLVRATGKPTPSH